MVVVKQVVVKIAAHLLGWLHIGIEVEAFMMGEGTGHYTSLDVTGDAQLTLNALLGGSGLFQFVVSSL